MSNTNVGNNGKEFNPTVTAMFDAPNFAKKVFKESGDTEGTAFLSSPIDDKGIAALDHVQLGSKLLLVKSPKLNRNGGATYYLEVLPPYTGGNKTATEQIEDGI
jgi:hypothetical protein